MTWALSQKNRNFSLKEPLQQKKFSVEAESFFHFNENYGYFSVYHPIVGMVTEEKEDIEVTNCLLQSIFAEIKNKDQCLFSADEVLAKVMAYRALETGMKVFVPTQDKMGNILLETYKVDKIIDLWHGMPAFGLIPEKKSLPSILLFRGTDLSFTSEKGWASILSDLDITGPGLKTFLHAQSEIKVWLEKMVQKGTPARAIGFSLGGSFVFYTMIYFSDLLNQNTLFPSKAFNPPGMKQILVTYWGNIIKKPPHVTYVNQGDFISKIGFLLPNVWEISLKQPMEVIQSHVTLVSMQPFYLMRGVNVASELLSALDGK